jgi:hypothetical protein
MGLVSTPTRPATLDTGNNTAHSEFGQEMAAVALAGRIGRPPANCRPLDRWVLREAWSTDRVRTPEPDARQWFLLPVGAGSLVALYRFKQSPDVSSAKAFASLTLD